MVELMNENKTEIGIDKLKFLFTKARAKLLTEDEALQNNLTQVFWETLKDKIEHGELINIGVRGEVRTGKSTVAIKIAWELNKFLEKVGKNQDISTKMYKYIFSDQTEFLRFINSEIFNVAITIDEFNRMASTGLNATTEEALFDYYSDVFAGKYIHRISCSPDVITDKNANIILDTIGKDEKKGIVRCKLMYRDIVSKSSIILGYVDIYVGDLIETWEKETKPIFFKRPHELKDKKDINELRNSDFYSRYQIKKYDRMDLLEKHGVRDIREPEYASIILDTLKELQDLAKIGKISHEIILTTVDEIRRRNKRIYSILALNEISTKARAILSVYSEINKLAKKKYGKGMSPDEVTIIERTINQLQDMVEKRIVEQQELRKLYQQYINIE